MADDPTVLFVGCGNMGAALAAGFAAAHPQAQVLAIDHDPERARQRLPAGARVRLGAGLGDFAGVAPDLVVLALKPQVLGSALGELQALCAGALVVSIAAGTPLARLAEGLGRSARLVRAMPNLPVVVGAGMTTLFAEGLDSADRALAEGLFAAVGEVAWLDCEADIDRATAIAGSGPAYFFAFVDHLAAAGVAAGLAPELAGRLARQTAVGAAAQLQQDARSAAVLRAAVCSPGGTTAAALAAMADLPALLEAGVMAAWQRAGELAAA